MKPSLLATLLALCLMPAVLTAAPRDAAWKAVDEAVNQGLPKTAIEHLDTIIPSALAERAHAEAIKAIGRKIALEGNIEGNRPEERIVRLQAEIGKAPAEMKPIMEAILARWYWHYFQQNRWRFMQRTETSAEPSSDIQTWDLARILTEIDRHFSVALADESTLKAIPVSEYDVLLERGTAPDSYRPTMWDFLVHEALDFYQAGEQAAVIAEDAFVLDAATMPIFAPVPEFLAWKLPASDGFSPQLKALELLQKLLRFHANDTDRSAYLDADLARLKFGGNHAVGDDDDTRFSAALERFVETASGHEIAARALAVLASTALAHDDPLGARRHAARGLQAAPRSAGGAECANLIAQIEQKSARIETERVWTAPWPDIRVTYRNVSRVFFRAVRVDFETHLRRSRWGLGNNIHDQYRSLLTTSPANSWDAQLPATEDYKERTEAVPASADLAPGYYAILASHTPDFEQPHNQLSVAYVWVSELALVTHARTDGKPLRGLVLDAAGGSPLAEARIQVWRRDREGRYQRVDQTSTDADGAFSWSGRGDGIVLVAEHQGRTVASANEIWARDGQRHNEADTRTVFFTDRSIYRPGQSIHYKGVSVRYDQDAGRYAVIPQLAVTVLFHDPNGKEIARATHRTNDFGSFSGVFTAPRDRVTGRMTIQVLNRPSYAWVTVEEYKRPKFQVELAAPAESPKLGARVALTGKATAYSGAAIDGATVKWRVERTVQMPLWCWWWRPSAAQAIAHGTATTDASGTFRVEFDAAPDRSVPEANEPVFAFTVHADVTDSAGETRSDDRVVRAGYTALRATIHAGAWQTQAEPVSFSIRTESIGGDPQPTSGSVTVHALKQPERVTRAPVQRNHPWWGSRSQEPAVDPTNPDSWEAGATIATLDFETDAQGAASVSAALQPGVYRAVVATRDRFGRAVTARHTVEVVDPEASAYAVRVPYHVAAPSWSVEPGGTFTMLWGTGYDTGRAFVEMECNGRILQRGWTAAGRTQATVTQPITEEMRGGVSLRITYVRENRLYTHQQIVDVPWSNKRLELTWETFRSKLQPGQAETWTAVVKGSDATRSSAEWVAALYDASLDQFLPHSWPDTFGVFRHEHAPINVQFGNEAIDFNVVAHRWDLDLRHVDWSYRSFPADLVTNLQLFGYADGFLARGAAMPAAAPRDEDTVTLSAFAISAEVAGNAAREMSAPGAFKQMIAADAFGETGLGDPALTEALNRLPTPDLNQVTARRNLQETAFFFPHLKAEADGTVRMSFTMPEALTEWRFLGFAHDRELRAGSLKGRTVTSKDLMVQPNPPRFVREGDTLEFTVKVSNQSDVAQSGRVRLTFADAASLESVDAALGNTAADQPFDIPARESRSYTWRISVPDGMGFLTYKAVGASAQVSDGEEGFLPVLSRRILVRESLPLPIRGAGTKSFEFTKLLDSANSKTLRHQSLTVQMVSQPAWYAVMALPYLMEFPYECSEQVFNRYYANALARHIASSDPKIRRIFDLWRNTPALESPLEKNEDLKSVLLEETPWVREAADESQARRNVGLLFDANHLDEESARTLRKLAEQQLGDGLWPWFPGGRPNEFISLYIVMGFGRLRNLGVETDVQPAVNALRALDAWMDRRYRDVAAKERETYVPTHLDAIYLYARTFFLRDQPVDDAHREAFAFFQRQAGRFWLKMDCRMCQAQVALALHRLADADTPRAILRSLKERSVSNEELGMFWRDQEVSWWWYRAPIESQAMMIEAFAEVTQDAEAVEACKVWLLKQKQTQDWKTTKATADAIYALLLRGTNMLASDGRVEVALGGEWIRPENVEAGTGFYEQKFLRGEIKPAMGEITVKKVDEGVSWGSVHWQYLEDMAKVTPHEATPLKLKKTIWIKETTDRGPVLKPVQGPLAVGDELVVRIELRTDRDMEYVHLKDQRGSGTEPLNVLSRYRYQDGLAYYESTRDTASHFFIEYLPKGVYVFEYSTRVQLKGSYQTGIAEIQCMYAPEFGSHSESFVLEVR